MARRERTDSEPPPRDESTRRSRLESVIPELIKKAVIGGVERGFEAQESLRNFISEQKLPREVLTVLLSQIDETKNGLFRVVAKEIRNFLEAVDWQRELQKLLTTVSFEIKTEIRFIPNDSTPDKLGKPEVKAAMKVKRADRDERRKDQEDRRRRRQKQREVQQSAEEGREPVEPEPSETPPPAAVTSEEREPPEDEGDENE